MQRNGCVSLKVWSVCPLWSGAGLRMRGASWDRWRPVGGRALGGGPLDGRAQLG
jgi:hypothetical protein